jgi:hypothetical protein
MKVKAKHASKSSPAYGTVYRTRVPICRNKQFEEDYLKNVHN